MGEIIKSIFEAQLHTLFIIAGMLFLLIAVVGNITGKIEPGDKARIASAILGVIFLAAGLTMHFIQKERTTPMPAQIIKPPNPVSPPSEKEQQKPLPPKPDDMPPPQLQTQTQYPQVVAELTSFMQTGKFITVVLVLRNTGGGDNYPWVCLSGRGDPIGFKKVKPIGAKEAILVDLTSGENFEPVNARGSLWDWCGSLHPGQSVGASITYEVPDPAKKLFSFSLPILNDSFYNLRVSQNLTPKDTK